MAQENVRQRLRLAFGEGASLHTQTSGGIYTATLRLPAAAGGANG
jgi:LytS/YehU family sensor histidine kinase